MGPHTENVLKLTVINRLSPSGKDYSNEEHAHTHTTNKHSPVLVAINTF